MEKGFGRSRREKPIATSTKENTRTMLKMELAFSSGNQAMSTTENIKMMNEKALGRLGGQTRQSTWVSGNEVSNMATAELRYQMAL